MSNATNTTDHNTPTYQFISSQCWTAALRSLSQNPNEALEWVIKRDFDENNIFTTTRILPIHTACALQPPLSIITALLEVNPKSASYADNQGLYPIHYACSNYASYHVIQKLLQVYPLSISLPDPYGMTPIHHLVHWGISSPKALDVVLNLCNLETLELTDKEGHSVLELAISAESNDHYEYVVHTLSQKLKFFNGTANINNNVTKPPPVTQRSISIPPNIETLSMDLDSDSHQEINKLKRQVSSMAMVTAEYKEEKESMDKTIGHFESKIALKNEMIQELQGENKELKDKVTQLQDLLKQMSNLID